MCMALGLERAATCAWPWAWREQPHVHGPGLGESSHPGLGESSHMCMALGLERAATCAWPWAWREQPHVHGPGLGESSHMCMALGLSCHSPRQLHMSPCHAVPSSVPHSAQGNRFPLLSIMKTCSTSSPKPAQQVPGPCTCGCSLQALSGRKENCEVPHTPSWSS